MTADIEAPKDLPYGQPERKEVSQKLGFPVLLGFIVNLNQFCVWSNCMQRLLKAKNYISLYNFIVD